MNEYITQRLAYEEGKASGRNSAFEWVCEELEGIIDTYADGEEITKAIHNLICRCREELT